MSSPKIENYSNLDILTFTVHDINVSLANALRRTLLSDIPLIVFKTTPIEENKCNILVNTSRLNNEIIKQRLSCIPVHIKEVETFPLDKYYMEVHIENTTDTMLFVTTENFKIKEHETKKEIDKETIATMFPVDDHTGYYIDFVRLRPKLSEELLGECLHLTCHFSIGTAKEDGMFNAVSTCSYGCTIDEDLQTVELAKKMQAWKDEGKTEEQIVFEQANWKLLDGKRIVKKNSFDFILQTIGIYDNNELLVLACVILINSFVKIDELIDKNELEIKNADSTMQNCVDIVLQNYDYTIGKVIEYFMYKNYYEKGICSFCGFKKLHPHDTYSIIRLAYVDVVDNSSILGNIKSCIAEAIETFDKLKKDFLRLAKHK